MEKSLAEIANSAENSRIRAEIWGDFVNWEGRRKGENGWLVNRLKEHGVEKVLDVALGDGVDTIYLLQQGFEVSCNEVDSAFREKAIENARKFGLTISPTTLDWRELDKKYREDSFDAALSRISTTNFVLSRLPIGLTKSFLKNHSAGFLSFK